MTWPLKHDYPRGGPIANLSAEWFNTVALILNEIQGVGCHVEKSASGHGWKIVVDALVNDNTRFRKIFDLIDITATTLKVWAFKVGATQQDMAIVAGALNAIGTGSAAFDTDITISADTYIYIQDEISGGNSHIFTLEVGSSIPTGGDVGAGGAYYYWPLWFIPFASGSIDAVNIIDLREFIHLQGFGN
jgi:hypothetical protein